MSKPNRSTRDEFAAATNKVVALRICANCGQERRASTFVTPRRCAHCDEKIRKIRARLASRTTP